MLRLTKARSTGEGEFSDDFGREKLPSQQKYLPDVSNRLVGLTLCVCDNHRETE